MNATDLGEIKVYRGKKNYKDLGQVVTVDGETGAIWFLFVCLFVIWFDLILKSNLISFFNI